MIALSLKSVSPLDHDWPTCRATACVAGEPFTAGLVVPLAAPTWTLERRPAGSAAELTDPPAPPTPEGEEPQPNMSGTGLRASFLPDVPGRYRLRATLGGLSEWRDVIAYSPMTLAWIPDMPMNRGQCAPLSLTDKLNGLRSLANDPAFNAAHIENANDEADQSAGMCSLLAAAHLNLAQFGI